MLLLTRSECKGRLGDGKLVFIVVHYWEKGTAVRRFMLLFVRVASFDHRRNEWRINAKIGGKT